MALVHPSSSQFNLTLQMVEAAKQNNLPLVVDLLRAGAPADGVLYQRFNALHYAAEHGNVPMVEALVQAGALAYDPEMVRAEPVLHRAIVFGQMDLAHWILDRMDPHHAVSIPTLAPPALTTSALTTIENAGEGAGDEIPSVLSDAPIDPHGALPMSGPGFERLAQEPIDRLNADGWTALHLAVVQDDVPLVQRLLDLGANPDALTPPVVHPLAGDDSEYEPYVDPARDALALAQGHGHHAVVAVLEQRTLRQNPTEPTTLGSTPRPRL